MSCNGCRVLRKGCSENCILRPCLQWIESSEAQGHATVFVAKFFGRAGLMSFISGVPDNQRPALFQSLLFEAAGRTVNPVNGAVGLLWTGNWPVCQAAVETVLRGGTLHPISEFLGCGGGGGGGSAEADEASDCTTGMFKLQRDHHPPPPPHPHPRGSPNGRSNTKVQKRRRSQEEPGKVMQLADLDLSLTPGFQIKTCNLFLEKRRLDSPSMNSEESVTTTCFERDQEPTLLKLFN